MTPKISLIGAGKFGINHLRTLVSLDKKRIIKFVGLVDMDSSIRVSAEKEFGINTTKEINDFLDCSDGFDVVTPPASHYKLVKFLLKNKKHVMVEKPLTLNSHQAHELVLLSRKVKKNLQVGHIFRYYSTIITLKKLIQKKDYFPYYLIGNFCQKTPPRHETGAIWIYMHGFDILDNLFEIKPKTIFASANLTEKSSNVETNVTVNLEYKKKLNATLTLGWIPTGKERKLELFSKKNRIVCDLLLNKIEIFQEGKKLQTLLSIQNEEPLLLELKEFIKSIKTGFSPKSNGVVGERIVRICECAIKSIQKNQVVTF